jgi:glycosyltransferase involved in cell wall biosynthesis
VVPNTVDTSVFEPPAQPRGGTGRLLCVGALAEKKGHVHLLEALALVRRERDVTLEIVGDGELREELERLTKELGLGGVVRFHGALSREEVAELMRACDLFVLPSLFENLPVVLIEAMASGLPAVATRVGGVPELVDGQAGLLVPPEDPEALARAIAEALESRERFDPEALAQTARERYGYEAFAAAWTAIYDEL